MQQHDQDSSAPSTRCDGATDLGSIVNAAFGLSRDLHEQRALEAKPEASAELQATIELLASSVIRPLRRAAELAGITPAPSAPSSVPWSTRVWDLAHEATKFRSAADSPAALTEAVAGLQYLACGRGPESETTRRRVANLADLQSSLAASIQIVPNGPYLLTNVTSITNWLGTPATTRPQMALCRCGASAIKPVCDGSHATINFDSAKDPARVPDRRDTYVGQQVTIFDNRGICQHSGFCTDRLATTFRAGEEPFVAPSGGRMDEIIRAVRDCPSGALSFAVDSHEAREQTDHDNERAAVVMITKDGPYRITGAIELVDEGKPVTRAAGASREHYALCRCGQSQNKPFCSGMHWYVDFHDPAPDPDRTPTVFEWCGGLPALLRMTRLFYEKFIPADALLAPVFANMAADHPERVAAWLGEVFGGPKAYSDLYGGYSRMISQHLGKQITEDKRARWAALLQQAALEAGLPNDAEFRSVFGSYIEWGSRLAVENSTIGAQPPEHMPMPHWDWQTAAGPPGSRVSALAPAIDDDTDVMLPADNEPVTYSTHIKSMFRQRDQRSMSFVFDLWSYADVKEHASEILRRLANGSMPCDGAWPDERIAAFERWISAGAPE